MKPVTTLDKRLNLGTPSLSTFTRVIILTGFYFVSGMVGKEASFMAGNVELVWPPSGIALAALLLFGYHYWPGVALGAVFFSLLNGLPLGYFTVGVVVGNTVGALLCTFLLERFVGFRTSLDRVRDVAGFVGLACLLGTTVNALFIVVSLSYVGTVPWADLFPSTLEWWVPNAMAGLVVTPFLLSWGSPSKEEWETSRMVEGAVCGTGLLTGTMISFTSWYAYGVQNYPLAFLPYPFLVWAALRFGQRGATTGTLVVSSVAIYSLLQGRGPFVTGTEKESLMLIGSYIGILAVTNMMLAAAATERRWAEQALRKSEEMFTLISENVSDLIAVTDEEGKRIYSSPSYQNLLGDTQMLAGSDPSSRVHPDDSEQVRESFQKTVTTGKGQRAEFRYLLPDNTTRYIESQGNYVRGGPGQPGKVVTVARDITARKQFEADLAKARDEALISARLKAEFLANMSHEIRTPMNGIIGMTNLLLHTELNAQQRDFADSIRNSADSLLTIINDILDFSKIEAGKLAFEILDFDLHETVENAVGLLAQQAAVKGLEVAGILYPDVPTRLRGDPGRLGQILNNLIGNAIKFTTNGEVTVRVTKESETETHTVLRFEVKDTGVGIPVEAQSRLFKAFTQADGSTTRKYGGTGLGLAICKQLVTLMHGQIGLDSAPGQGSTFWFAVPLEKQPVGKETVAAEAGSLTNARVLIVDDNATNRQILHYQTARWKMRNDCAASGPEALERLRAAAGHDPYALALLDFQMPEMDGLMLAQAIRADPTLASTRLVMLTSLDKQLDPETMAATGILACLMKPVKQSRLYDTLVNVMGKEGAPLRPSKAAGLAGAPVAMLPPRHLRILLAEDNTINQKVALGQLQHLGYSAEAVMNGKEVLEALARQPYDIIFMDCQMPEMDGYEATMEIRRTEQEWASSPRARSPVHIIAMTANAMQGDREKCLAVGMNDYVSKPVEEEDLVAALERWRPLPAPEPVPAPPARALASAPVPGAPAALAPAPAAAKPAAGPEEPAVNFKRLRRVALDDSEKVRELIDLYLSQSEMLFKALDEALRNKSAKQVEQTAHKLCGSSSSCGMTAVVGPLRELEKAGRENQLDGAGPLFAEAGRQLERVRHSLLEYRQTV